MVILSILSGNLQTLCAIFPEDCRLLQLYLHVCLVCWRWFACARYIFARGILLCAEIIDESSQHHEPDKQNGESGKSLHHLDAVNAS